MPAIIARTLSLVFVCYSSILLVCGQQRNEAYKQYIRQYADEAIRQMQKHGIPASITMAQALVESGAGKSYLAVEGKNHFGIKCHRSWQGETIYSDDDEKQECFRRYGSVSDSFTDHSNFLKGSRYSRLFKLAITDYRGWAKGLQECGYATNKGYANMLIRNIELYALYELDRGLYPDFIHRTAPKKPEPEREKAPQPQTDKKPKAPREGFMSYGLLYVLAQDGDTYASIAQEMDLSLRQLATFNDVPTDFPLRAGDVVYLQRKNARSVGDYVTHTVEVGDSMHSIAQKYGIRVKELYKMNGKDWDYVPEEGDILQLR